MRLSLGLLALLSACDSPGETTTVSATALTTLTAGEAELRIPNGALAQDTEMVFRFVHERKLGKDGREEVPVAPVIEIIPHDVEFLQPVTLTFPLIDSQTAELRINGQLTAVDGWQLAKGDDERSRPPRTQTDVNSAAGLGVITIELNRGGYVWVAHEDIGRPGLAANLGTQDEVLVDVEEVELDIERMQGAVSFTNRTSEPLYGVQVTAGSHPLSAEPGTQALAQMAPEQQLSSALEWRCLDDGPAQASARAVFQLTSSGSVIALREYREMTCYEEDIIIDPIDVPDLCPEPDGQAVITAAFESIDETSALSVWDEGACQTVVSEVADGIEQVWFHARPQQDPGQERARVDYVLLSATLAGEPGDGSSTAPRVSDIGNYAVFETQANNLIGAVADTEVAIIKFFPETLQPAYITRFDVNDPATTSPALSGNGQWVAAVTEGRIRVMDLRPTTPVAVDFHESAHSPELDKSGRYLAFVTTVGIDPLDTDTVESIYIADRDPDDDGRYTGQASFTLVSRLASEATPSTVELISVSADGTQILWIGDGTLQLTDVSGGRPATRLLSLRGDDDVASNVLEADLSSDGDYAVFTTSEFSNANPAVLEAWVVDTTTLAIARVSVDESGNPATDSVYEPRLAPDGEIVALRTSAILSADDTDGGPTVYRMPNPLLSGN